jgi:putative membrane protein
VQTAIAQPFCGPAPLPQTLAGAWLLEPWLLAGLALGGAAGLAHLAAARAGADRHGAFGGAMAVAVVAFVSPLCALTVALFAARTMHHIVLLAALAPALALAFPWRRAPLGPAFVALSAALWAWHLPALYTAAWRSDLVYWAMQAALVLPAWTFWAAVLARRDDLGGGLAAAGLVAGLAGQMGLIGAILVFAPAILYPEHLLGAAGFGLDALADQQLAGLVMWVPGMAPLALVAALLLRQGWRMAAAAA